MGKLSGGGHSASRRRSHGNGAAVGIFVSDGRTRVVRTRVSLPLCCPCDTRRVPCESVITDEDVAADCVVSLDIDKVVPRGAVQVAVMNGWITLSGEIRHHFQRSAAV